VSQPNELTLVAVGQPLIREDFAGYSHPDFALAPMGISTEIIDRLHREIVRAVANPKVAKLFVDLGTLPVAGTSKEFAAFIRSEMERWGRVVRTAGIPLE
jgi:tripartite-type tricarboxylate transporter receptor subunit TctC